MAFVTLISHFLHKQSSRQKDKFAYVDRVMQQEVAISVTWIICLFPTVFLELKNIHPPPHTLSVQRYPQLLIKIRAFYTQHGRSTQVQNNNSEKLIPVLVELQPKQGGEDNTVSPFYRSGAEEQAD